MDILGFLQTYNIPYQTKGKNVSRGWLAVNCPYCDDTGFHGGIPLSGSHYYCWRCAGHKLDETLRLLSGLSYFDYKTAKEQYDGIDSFYEELNKKYSHKDKIELPGMPLTAHDRKYLRNRGYNPAYLADRYGLLSGKPFSDWEYRVIITIRNNGRLVSWQGRDTSGYPDRIRYKTLATELSVMDAKSILYNIDNCKNDFVGVVEGAPSVWRLGDNFCATLGTSVTEAQIRRLSKFKRVVIVFDSEVAAQTRAQKLAGQVASLGASVEVVDMELGDKRDPGDMTEKEVSEFLQTISFT